MVPHSVGHCDCSVWALVCLLVAFTQAGCNRPIAEEPGALSVVSTNDGAKSDAVSDPSKITIGLQNTRHHKLTVRRVETTCSCIECRNILPFHIASKDQASLDFEVVHPPDGQVQVVVSVFIDPDGAPDLTFPVTVGSRSLFPVFSHYPREVLWRNSAEPVTFHVTTMETTGSPPWLTECDVIPDSVTATIGGLPDEVRVAGNVIQRNYTIDVSAMPNASLNERSVNAASVTLVTSLPTRQPIRIRIVVDDRPAVTISPEVLTASDSRRNEAPTVLRAIARGPDNDWKISAPAQLPDGIASVMFDSLSDDPESRLVRIELVSDMPDRPKEIPLKLLTDIPSQPEAHLLIRIK